MRCFWWILAAGGACLGRGAWFVNSVHSVYLYLHISLCFTLHVCLAIFFYFFCFISFTFFYISFTLCMLPLLAVNKDCYINIYFYRAMLCKRGLCCHAVSVCPSVTFVDHVKTNKHIFEIFSPSGSDTILVFPYQRGCRYSDGNPLTGASNASGV